VDHFGEITKLLMDKMKIVLGNVKKIKEKNSDEPGVLEEM